MGIYISKLKTNVKQRQTIELGEKTLIIGKNGSGKSSILNSIELCFGGYVSDYRGKTVKSPNDLIRLSTEKELKVQCQLSNGSKKSYSISRSVTGSVSKPKKYGKIDLSLPVQEITEIVESSSKVFKSWLLEHIGIEMSQEDLTSFCKDHGVDPSLIDVENLVGTISSQLESAKERVKKLADNIRSRKKTIEEFSQTIDPNVDLSASEKYEELKKRLYHFDSDSSQMEEYQRRERQLSTLLEQVKANIIPIKGKIDTIKQHSHLLPTREEILANNVRSDVIRIFEIHETIGQTENCMICDNGIKDFKKRKDILCNAKQDVANKIELLKTLASLEAQLKSAEDQIVSLNNEIKDVEAAKHILAQTFRSLDSNDIDHLRSKLESLKQKVNAVSLYHIRMKEIARVKKEYENMKENHKEAKRLVNALQALQSDFVDSAKEDFVQKLNEVLSFEIDIHIDDKNIDIGKRDSGKLCFGLSGAEYLELKFAFSQVLYPNNSVILSEDKAIDEDRLSEMMENLSTFSGQVILTSVTRPSTIPSDWTVIDL